MKKCATLLLSLLVTITSACMPTAPSPMPSLLPCKKCAKNLITVTQAGLNAKPMDDDVPVTGGPCARRIFKCKGNMAAIALSNAGGPLAPITDGGTGAAEFTVTCNAAGTGWEANGMAITAVECSTVPPCKTCPANLIAIMDIARPMAVGPIVTTGTCAEREFTCTAPNAFIGYNTGAGRIADGGAGIATLKVTCNAAGTAWRFQGIDIIQATCDAASCKTCAANLISITLAAINARPMGRGPIVTTGSCAERTFTCRFPNAFVDYNTGAGRITDGGTGTATLKVVCNAAGTAWTNQGMDITQAECAAGSCKTCATNTVAVTVSGTGRIVADNIDSTGTCRARAITCDGMGNPAFIIFSNGAKTVAYSGGGGGRPNRLICNLMGTGWQLASGTMITNVNCHAGDCKTCDDSLFSVTNSGNGAMIVDPISRAGACNQWTFTCTGVNAVLTFTDGFPIVHKTVTDAGTDVAAYTLDCDMAGTWNTRLTVAVAAPIQGCYITNWAVYRQEPYKFTPERVPVGLCTHIFYAFAALNAATFEARMTDVWADVGLGNFAKTQALKKKNPGMKTLLSFGGWTESESGIYNTMAADPAKRARFIASAWKLANENGFDGIDMDWEYPGAADRVTFVALIKELKAASGGKMVTAAVSAGIEKIDAGYDVPAFEPYIDLLTVMTYDFHGAWENVVGHHAAYSETIAALTHWSSKGMPKSKLLMGIGAYGRGWIARTCSPGTVSSGIAPAQRITQQAGIAALFEMVTMNGVTVQTPDGPFLQATLNGQLACIGYDDRNAILRKMDFVKSQGYGGAFSWTIDFDDSFFTVHNAIKDGLSGSTLPTPRPVPVINPETPRPVPVIVPETPRPVPVINPETPRPVPVIVPETPRPVPVINPETPRPVPVINPETPRPVPVITARTPRPVPVINPETPRPVPVINPETPRPVPVITLRTPRPVPVITPRTPRPVPVITPRTPRPVPVITPRTLRPVPVITAPTPRPVPVFTPSSARPSPTVPQPTSAPSTGPCITGEMRANSNARKYEQCVFGSWLIRDCPPGTVFDGLTKTFVIAP